MVQNAAGEVEGSKKGKAVAGTLEEVAGVADYELAVEAVRAEVVEEIATAGAVEPELALVFELSLAKLMAKCCVACSVYH